MSECGTEFRSRCDDGPTWMRYSNDVRNARRKFVILLSVVITSACSNDDGSSSNHLGDASADAGGGTETGVDSDNGGMCSWDACVSGNVDCVLCPMNCPDEGEACYNWICVNGAKQHVPVTTYPCSAPPSAEAGADASDSSAAESGDAGVAGDATDD